MERVCIYPKEAAQILNLKERQTQRKFRDLRKELNKKKHQIITVKEFAKYLGIPKKTVLAALKGL